MAGNIEKWIKEVFILPVMVTQQLGFLEYIVSISSFAYRIIFTFITAIEIFLCYPLLHLNKCSSQFSIQSLHNYFTTFSWKNGAETSQYLHPVLISCSVNA